MNHLPYTHPNKLPLVLLLICFSCFSGVGQEKQTLEVGTAKVNITPSTPIPMSGYGARQEAFKGIHDSLYAYVVLFDNGTVRSGIITADLIGFSNSFFAETSQLVADKTGIPATNLMLAATHNHGGPRNNTYGVDEHPEITDYVNYLQQQIVAAVEEASESMVPAKIGAGAGRCSMNINRRAIFADGNVGLGRNPDGPCDKEVSVVRIDDLSDQPMALLINWATHGTTGGQDNYQITGDWPGATARFVEEMYDRKIIAPVTVGASGDINPIYGPNDQFRDIDAIGMILAKEVVRVAGEIETYPTTTLTITNRKVLAKGRKPSDHYRPNQPLEPSDPVELNLWLMKVGGVVFTGISGEVMTEIGMDIKKRSPYSHTVVITHCNGSAGYLITDNSYTEGGYEAMVSRTMPGTAELIVENLLEMIRELP